MYLATLQRTAGLLRASARGQLLLLLPTALVVALPMVDLSGEVTNLTNRLVLATLLGLVAIAVSVRLAVRGANGYDTVASDLPDDAVRVAPRALAQAVLACAPAVAVWALAILAASLAPLLGLALFVVVVPLTILAPVPVILALGAVGSGSRDWTPTATLRLLRTRRAAACTAALVPVSIALPAAVPLLVVASVLAATLDTGASVAWSVAFVPLVPLLGAGAAAAWERLGGTVIDLDRAAATDPAGAAAAGPDPVTPAPPPPVAWTDGPSWDTALEAGTVWGTWLRMPAASDVAFRVTWRGGPAPQLQLTDASGTWRSPGSLTAPGDALVAHLPAGDTYLQLASCSPADAQAVTVTLLLPAATAVA